MTPDAAAVPFWLPSARQPGERPFSRLSRPIEASRKRESCAEANDGKTSRRRYFLLPQSVCRIAFCFENQQARIGEKEVWVGRAEALLALSHFARRGAG